jgi:clan AA aspartic protease
MIAGQVDGREPRVTVTLLNGGQALAIEFVVDTGFNGYLTLPPAAVTALGLPFLYHIFANFADDRSEQVAVHEARIRWHEAEREVEVLATGRRPLLGTLLLLGRVCKTRG